MHRPICGPVEIKIEYKGQAASDLIKDQLSEDKPLLVGRLGRLEREVIRRYQNSRSSGSTWQKTYRYFFQKSGPFWWDDDFRFQIQNNAGFFPAVQPALERLAQRLLDDLVIADILAVFGDEGELIKGIGSLEPILLTDLEPYYHPQPWTSGLKNERVLVIHPFSKSIQKQYARRELLFADPEVLPDFELITYQPVQSIASNPVDFSTWFEALDWMCKQVEQIDFTIAIIGAGAYGFPLGAHIKRIGRKAIHLGGATQILFGIRGNRWDERPFFKGLFNENWVHPLAEERPANFRVVEGGAYW